MPREIKFRFSDVEQQIMLFPNLPEQMNIASYNCRRDKRMERKVKLGDLILAKDTGSIHEVHAIWPQGASKFVDFGARRLEPMGNDRHGNSIPSGRGFSYSNDN